MSALLTTESRVLGAAREVKMAGVEVAEISPAEYMEAANGRLLLDVPNVRGEHRVAMRGTVPTEWTLL